MTVRDLYLISDNNAKISVYSFHKSDGLSIRVCTMNFYNSTKDFLDLIVLRITVGNYGILNIYIDSFELEDFLEKGGHIYEVEGL